LQGALFPFKNWTPIDGVACVGNSVGSFFKPEDLLRGVQDGAPISLDMYGHFDRYIAKYLSYKPGPISESEFDIPDVCQNDSTRSQVQVPPQTFLVY
jgi:hypothetical protein